MSADGSLDQRYDFALLGTSLPLSILSAALSRAGYSVLHVDDAEHYGGPWASLTLQELTQRCQRKNDGGIVDMNVKFTGKIDGEIPTALQKLNRHFAISLAPTLLPCSGPTIEVLVRSRVANYCTFRLLQQTAVCYRQGKDDADWSVRTVPSSKEDIFKDKTLGLVEKRKLMRLLQQAMPKREDDGQQSTSASLEAQGRDPLDKSFYDYLTARPGHSFSHQLASDVAFGVALCASSKDTTDEAMQRIQRHISGVGRYGNSAYLVGQYGGAGEMAQCYCRASAVQGGTFVLAHGIRTLHRVKPTNGGQTGEEADRIEWEVALEDIEGTAKVGCVVGDETMLARVLSEEQSGAAIESQTPALQGRQAFGILLLDRGMNIRSSAALSDAQPTDEQDGVRPTPPETALVVFPPSGHDTQNPKEDGSVWALQMGEGTFSCPKGTYLVYLYAALAQSSDALKSAEDARALLRHAREGVLHLASQSTQEWSRDTHESQSDDTGVTPLFEFYAIREASLPDEERQENNKTSSHDRQRQGLMSDGLLSVPSKLNNVATALDDATMQAEDLYWLLCGAPNDQEGIRDAATVRRDAAAVRRRQQRADAGQNPVGRGLAGIVKEASSTSPSESSQTVCDFFPATDASADD